MTDRSKNQDPISPAQRADSDPTGPLKAPPPPPPPAPLPRREEEVEGLDPDEEVVLLDDEPEEELTCGQVNSGPRMSGGRSRKSTSKAARPAGEERPRNFTPTQRLLILDVWGRSGLAGSDFAPLVSISPAALYKWKPVRGAGPRRARGAARRLDR